MYTIRPAVVALELKGYARSALHYSAFYTASCDMVLSMNDDSPEGKMAVDPLKDKNMLDKSTNFSCVFFSTKRINCCC
jgi:hypothetical protein